MAKRISFVCNGRNYCYKGFPRPVCVICLDGCSDQYIDHCISSGNGPNLSKMSSSGFRGTSRCSIPSFTNVNNASIVTGCNPSVHGITGNHFFDRQSLKEIMTGKNQMRCSTIFNSVSQQPHFTPSIVTSKDKLLSLLTFELDDNFLSYSFERMQDGFFDLVKDFEGHDALKLTHWPSEPFPSPSIYSPSATILTLLAGVSLISNNLSNFCYLSTTDFVQHKYAPDTKEAIDFMGAIDKCIGLLLDLGTIVGITADHGMSGKHNDSGEPNIVWLSDLFKRMEIDALVSLPITDPYVRHHGSLGSFANIYLSDPTLTQRTCDLLNRARGIAEVFPGSLAALKFELPVDRIGDIVVISEKSFVFGKDHQNHDLSQLGDLPLRSHGGRYEDVVPFLLSEPLSEGYLMKSRSDLRNFDIFEYTINNARSS